MPTFPNRATMRDRDDPSVMSRAQGGRRSVEAPAMRDQAKTKAQLVEELAKLRARVAELEATENMAHWRYKGRAKCPNWA